PDVDHALMDGTIIRTHVLRPTWHFVAVSDIRWVLALTAPRVHRNVAHRFRDLGLDHQTLTRCETVIASALEGRKRMTREEIGGVLASAGIDPSGQRLPFILLHFELEAVICSGGLAGKQQTYALFDERVPKSRRFDHDEALAELARRYLQSHGPATVQDLRWWSSLTTPDLNKALELLGSTVRSEVLEGRTFWWLNADARATTRGRRAHLLQPYDETLVGYTESRFFGDPREPAARSAWKNPMLPSGVVLLNGRVAGQWKRTMKGRRITVEAFLYDDPTNPETRLLENAAAELGRFFGRPATFERRAVTLAR
ncbi:MAG: winged helix DNA-binding domain-containing protein, partial [Actinomycetota bacterium]|nr:winged helix DNA-binding domain-containing protein [Actinomycetota bacterium]